MNGPHALSMMNENNDYDSNLNTSTTTNYAKTFIASTLVVLALVAVTMLGKLHVSLLHSLSKMNMNVVAVN